MEENTAKPELEEEIPPESSFDSVESKKSLDNTENKILPEKTAGENVENNEVGIITNAVKNVDNVGTSHEQSDLVLNEVNGRISEAIDQNSNVPNGNGLQEVNINENEEFKSVNLNSNKESSSEENLNSIPICDEEWTNKSVPIGDMDDLEPCDNVAKLDVNDVPSSDVKLLINSCGKEKITESVPNNVSVSPKERLMQLNNISESEDEDDILLSELESELHNDSDDSSHTTDVPHSDEDLQSRISYCSSEISLDSHAAKSSLLPVTNKHQTLSRSSSSNSSTYPESYKNTEYHEIQLEALERTIVHLRQNVNHYKQRLRKENEAAKKNLEKTKSEFGSRIEKLNKMYEGARKEKESMVMKFANAEKDKIKYIKFKDDMERKVKEASRDREMLLNKMKQFNAERTQLNANLEAKVTENRNVMKENEKLKEEMSSKDVKIKWAQNKLKNEVDAHKETQNKLEKIHQKLIATREEADQVRKDCQDMIRRYQESEEIRSVSLDKELKVKTTELEFQMQQRSDQEEVCVNVREELENCRHKNKVMIDENTSLTIKIQNLEKERLDYVQTVSKLKDQINTQKERIVDMQAKLTEMDGLSIQLDREMEKAASCHKEVERLRQTNADLQSDMDACHVKEGELLEFTQRITSKNVQLQNDISVYESKISSLEDQISQVILYDKELDCKLSSCVEELREERELRQQETQILARKLAEKTKAWEQLTVQLGDSNNENRVLKRRHLASVKELTRELYQSKKRIEFFEVNYQAQNNTDRLSLNSRTNSNGSLDNLPNNNSNKTISNHTPSVTFIGVKENSKSGQKAIFKKSKKKIEVEPVQEEPSPPKTILQPVRQVLIEKIVKLQKIHARKREKIEFLEEHISQLLKEIKKKSRIIQSYVMREEVGALISNTMDENKADLSRKGGIMASLYHSHSLDGAMTLELSLEINSKLQAVLEDTLLKNITLKENISTLGEEISRLSKNNKSSS